MEGLRGVSGQLPPGQHCWSTRYVYLNHFCIYYLIALARILGNRMIFFLNHFVFSQEVLVLHPCQGNLLRGFDNCLGGAFLRKRDITLSPTSVVLTDIKRTVHF